MKKYLYRIPESFLRTLWEEQFFLQFELVTTDGRSVCVLDSGKPNSDSGPDFLGASVIIGGVTFRGDVEFHNDVAAWKRHRHHTDKRYNATILHVVVFGDEEVFPTRSAANRAIPLVSLSRVLPFIAEQFENRRNVKKNSTLLCAEKNLALESPLIESWLTKLALQRMEMKIRRFSERMKFLAEEKIRKRTSQIHEPLNQFGIIVDEELPEEIPREQSFISLKDFRKKALWEQVLYEGIFETLGYSKNKKPFLQLAQGVPLEMIREFLEDAASSRNETECVRCIEAVCVYISGLLPSDSAEQNEVRYIAQCRTIGTTISEKFRFQKLSALDWQFFRLHPENFPTIRIAGGSRIVARLLKFDVLRVLISFCKDTMKNSNEKLRQLESLFIVSADGFWKTQYRFGSASGVPLKTFVGKERARDIVLNVVFPLCLLYARTFKDVALRKEVLALYSLLSHSADNAITKKIRQQLVYEKFPFRTAMYQQGAIQLYNYFCADAKCNECEIGKRVF
ncbi:MAG: DUF2851 family protein [Ignavibacteria bacterium]|nr:DUF2851 family protein [Ignavibacteria bacterium]